MANHHFIAGQINYFDWAIFNSYVTNGQSLCGSAGFGGVNQRFGFLIQFFGSGSGGNR